MTWPSPRWRNDPVGFARDVLGVELWSAQRDIVESIRDHRNTTVRSGHKCGKSTALAVAALWFYCSFDRARVFLTAVKSAQIEEVIWKEVRRLYRGAKIPIGGELFTLARTGLRDEDERQIWGATSRDGEGLAGISGPNVLVLADEASGIPDRFFETLGSSLAGSGGTVRKCYISNPTRTTGEFYRSHTTSAALFNCIHISSEDTPNARREGVIPGLAGPEWIAEKKLEYGEDSHAYNVRVRGNFVHDKDGKIVSLDAIANAQAAWDEAPDEGPLQLGIDPAGDGMVGDETAMSLRRGMCIRTTLAWRGLTEDGIVEHAVALIRDARRARDVTPRVVVDVEGGIGTRVYAKLRAHLERFKDEFEVVAVRGGKVMWGSPEYHLVRDALWGQMQKWIRAGGAIPDDVKLGQDLNAPSFTEDANRRYRATDKKVLRKELGRSPDRGDSACLAVWGWESIGGEDVVEDADRAKASTSARSSARDDLDDLRGAPVDPYAALDAWGHL